MDAEWFRWTVGIWLVVMSGIIKWLWSRIDSKANADSVDKRFNEVLTRFDKHMDEDREMHREVGRKLDRTNEHLSTTNTTLAALAGRFDERSRNGHA